MNSIRAYSYQIKITAERNNCAMERGKTQLKPQMNTDETQIFQQKTFFLCSRTGNFSVGFLSAIKALLSVFHL
jgi:hypothetical protein